MTACTQTEFAKLVGKDRSYVTRLKHAGRLVLTADGLVDVDKSQELIANTSNPSYAHIVAARGSAVPTAQAANGLGDSAIGNSYQTARAVNEKYKALAAKLEYEKAAGKLVNSGEAALFAADLAASFRAALEVLPDRLAPELVAVNDMESVRAVLVESFEHILTDLADKVAKWQS